MRTIDAATAELVASVLTEECGIHPNLRSNTATAVCTEEGGGRRAEFRFYAALGFSGAFINDGNGPPRVSCSGADMNPERAEIIARANARLDAIFAPPPPQAPVRNPEWDAFSREMVAILKDGTKMTPTTAAIFVLVHAAAGELSPDVLPYNTRAEHIVATIYELLGRLIEVTQPQHRPQLQRVRNMFGKVYDIAPVTVQ